MSLTLSAPSRLYLKAMADGEGLFEGYASLFNIADSEQDVVMPGAFDTTLAEWRKNGRAPALLWQHDRTQPIGTWLDLRVDQKGLYVRGRLFVDDIAQAAEAYALMKKGALSGLSIGYRPEQASRDMQRGLRLLERIKLFEISLVTFPALETARVYAVKEGVCSDPSPAFVNDVRRFCFWLQSVTPVRSSSNWK